MADETPLEDRLEGVAEPNVSDIYEIGLRQVAAADALMGRIEAKATGLLGVIGFCMTLAISFGGWSLLENAPKVAYGNVLVWLFVVVLLFGVASGGFALAVLRVSEAKHIDEDDVFRAEAIKMDRTGYRRYVAAHAWYVSLDNFKINETKAKHLWNGQRFFAAFLAGIVALSTVVAWSALRVPVATATGGSAQVTTSASVAASTSATYDAGTDGGTQATPVSSGPIDGSTDGIDDGLDDSATDSASDADIP